MNWEELKNDKERLLDAIDEKLGLIVRNISSITAKDAWHYKKGYQSLAKAQAFVWHKDKGLIDIMMHNIE